MDLSYDWGFNTSQYNGNIAGQQWANAGDQATRSYGYAYDAANRLLYANFNQYFSGTWAQTDPGNSQFTVNFNVAMGTFTNGNSNNDAYDENGNIQHMQQYGFTVAGSNLPMDDLTYTYTSGTNELQNVRDAQNNPQTLLGDFRTSALHPQYSAKLAATTSAALQAITDYSYDNNGNLTQDLNKDIATVGTVNGIVYNFLNLPYQISIKNKGTIVYIYDASGSKIEKRVNEPASAMNNNTAALTTTTYLGAFVYQNNALQYFGMEEGRIRPVTATTYNNNTLFAYDYVLKDHLGNTRVTLTDELQQDGYIKLDFEGASNTDQAVINQNAIWDNNAGQAINVTAVRVAQNIVANFGTTTSNGNYISSITKAGGAIGAAKMIKVMAGDQLNMSLDWMYASATVDNRGANGLTSLVNSLVGMITGSPDVTGALKGQAAAIATNTTNNNGAINFFTPEGPGIIGSPPPKAYLHVLLFSDQFVFDKSNSIFWQIGANALNAKQTITQIVSVLHSGYAYIYFSNESNTPVYFDNFMLTHVRSPLLETEDYYPFGLTMAGISSQSAGKLENKLKYNGKELQHKEFSDGSGLEWEDYGARDYDVQIGRWFTIDPRAEKFFSASPYAYTVDNPVLLLDRDGKDWTITITTDKNGNSVYNILFTGAVLNSSSNKKVDVNGLAKAIQKQIEKMFSGVIEKNSDGSLKIAVEAHAIIGVVQNKKDLLSTQTLFEVKDATDKDFQTSSPGTTIVASANNGKEVAINESQVADMISGKNTKTMPHEVGHTGGLRDPLQDFVSSFFGLSTRPGPTANAPSTNFMYQGRIASPTGPTREQMERMYRLYQNGDLNKSTGTHPINVE